MLFMVKVVIEGWRCKGLWGISGGLGVIISEMENLVGVLSLVSLRKFYQQKWISIPDGSN